MTDLIPKTGQITSAKFADYMLKAEYPDGLDYEPQKREECLALFASKFEQHFGGTQVDAALFHY